MMDNRPSITAAWVAVWRGLGASLPPSARLATDPYGLKFGPGLGDRVGRLSDSQRSVLARALLATPLRRLILWMQIRTRVIDDVLLEFIRTGGRQVILLGAGYDSRAVRLVEHLHDSVVFEVDHPATQERKHRILQQSFGIPDNVRFVSWDFEHKALNDLPQRLVECGHDPQAPTLVVWEGVILYLSREAIVATLEALRALNGAGSKLVFNYTERRTLRWFRRLASHFGEAVKPGWSAEEMRELIEACGFSIEWDRRDDDLARELFPPTWAARFKSAGGHLALARRNAPS